jgi:hypothetical protein
VLTLTRATYGSVSEPRVTLDFTVLMLLQLEHAKHRASLPPANLPLSKTWSLLEQGNIGRRKVYIANVDPASVFL